MVSGDDNDAVAGIQETAQRVEEDRMILDDALHLEGALGFSRIERVVAFGAAQMLRIGRNSHDSVEIERVAVEDEANAFLDFRFHGRKAVGKFAIDEQVALEKTLKQTIRRHFLGQMQIGNYQYVLVHVSRAFSLLPAHVFGYRLPR